MKKLGVKLTIPGLLFIDTPGHEAFTNLRKRGGSISDLAILLIDVTAGIQPQTIESIEILKMNKVPFVIGLNKIDLLPGWEPNENMCFKGTIEKQAKDVQLELDKRLYDIVGKMYELGFNCERFDRVDDFTKQIVIIPISAKTGEGIPELLLFISGLTQKYMANKLEIDESKPGRGTILEVKEVKGMGTTIDVIIYDGVIRKGDTIVVGGRDKPIITKVRALLQPKPLQEIRDIKRQFEHVDEVVASAGVKIIAPGLEDAVAGSTVCVASERVDEIVDEVASEMRAMEVETDKNGIIVKTNSLGSLEALIHLLGKYNIPIRRASVGNVTKRDVVEAESVEEFNHYLGVIFAFNTKVLDEARDEAEEAGIKIFETDVIYKLVEEYEKWKEEEKKREIEELLKSNLYPVKIEILRGYVFRKSKPAIVGVEVLDGILKSPLPIMNENGRRVGKIKSIQKEGENVEKAEKGERVAVSIEGVTIGRQIKEGDILYANIPLKQIPELEEEVEHKELLEEIKIVKKKHKLMEERT